MARPRTWDTEKVLAAAVEAFREKGYDGISLPELVDRLGICRQSLYTAFGDKHALYLKALEHWGAREVDAKLSLLAAPGSPLENVRTVVRGWADLAARCPGDGCLTATGIVEARGDEEARAVVEAQVARLEDGYRDALERARSAGELRRNAHPERIARALVSFTYGMGVLVRLPSSGRRIADTVSVMLDLLAAAAAAPE